MRLLPTFLISVLCGLCGAGLDAQAEVPIGWHAAGSAPSDYEFSTDGKTAATGTHSALIVAKPGASGFGTLMQTIAADDYRGGRWRLSGYLKTDQAVRAQMWMRIDGSKKNVMAFDNMDSRPVTGTTDWKRYDIVLDVPTDAVAIAFGFFLVQGGKVWGDDTLDKVDEAVPATATGPPLPKRPVNTGFEQ